MNFFASLAILTCPECAKETPFSAIEFRNQLSIVAHPCRHRGAELQVEKSQFGGAYKVELLMKN
jgi:hypothetical protein